MGCTTSTVAPNKSYSTPGPSRSDQARRVQETQPEGLVYEDAVDNSSNLFAAIKRGDIPTVQRMLGVTHNGDGDSTPSVTMPTVNVNSLLGMWNSTPLIVATQYGQKEIANMLLAESDLGDLNHRNDKGASVLLYACMEGLTDIVKDLLSKQVEVSLAPTLDPVYNQAVDQSVRCTPYSIAVLNGHQTIVAMLIDAGMDVNLHFEFPTLKSVLKNTINAARDSVKDVPEIQHSAHISSTHSADSTVHASAAASKVGVSGSSSGGGGVLFVTPILLAAASGKLNVFRELLWRNANCSTTDGDGSTVLHHLGRAKVDSAAMFQELKKNNKLNDALLDVRDKNGDTVLLVASEAKQVELLQLLLEEGCSTAHTNTYTGTSALHTAVKKRCIEVVHLLLEYGADPLLLDKNKVSALDLAMKLHKDSEIHKAMHTAGTAWKELRGLNNPSYGVVVGNTATTGASIGVDKAPMGGHGADNNGDHDVSVLHDIHDLPTVRMHATISTKMNNYTTVEASTIDYTTYSNSTSPVKSKDSRDSVQVYDSPEHVHIRGAESTNTNTTTTPIKHTTTAANTTNKTATTNDKVLEHLGRRASEFQAQLALEESIKNAANTTQTTNTNHSSTAHQTTKNTTTSAGTTTIERRASVLTAEEEVLLLDNEGDIDLTMLEDGPMLEIIGTPMSVSSPVKVPHHTPHAPAPPGGRTMFTFTDTSVKDSMGGGASGSAVGVGVGGVSSVKESSNNSANTSTTNQTNANTIATPTGSAAIAQASTLYRTGSFKSPTLPKKDNSVERVSVVRKSSTGAGSFKSPYAVGSGIGGSVGTPVTSRKIGGSNTSSGENISSEQFATPVKGGTSGDNETPADTYTTPLKSDTATTSANPTTTNPINPTATTLVSSTAVKPTATTTTSAIVSQSAYAPRRPSEIPTTDGARSSVRSGRYGVQKNTAGTNASSASGVSVGGGSGKVSKGSGKAGVSSIPTSELVAPIPRTGAEVTDNTNTNIDTTDSAATNTSNTNTNTSNTNNAIKTPSRPIVASPPAKPVSEAKSFRRASSSTVKKGTGAK